MKNPTALGYLQKNIYFIRGHKVMVDDDLAVLYKVTTKRLNEQVKRTRERFPAEFMFRLTNKEMVFLMRSQNATGSRRNVRYRPYAFTEHGAVMLASVLKSQTAIQASIEVVKAFVHLRELLSSNRDLSHRLIELERRYDGQFKVVFDAIRQLMAQPDDSKRLPVPRVHGFKPD
jgi:hypothetical protein